MGNALTVMVLAEEELPQASTRHSADYVRAMVRRVGAATWVPPREPPCIDRPEVAAKHAEAVRKSLESFLNERLAELESMVRTGRWMMPRARVRVEFDDV